MQEALASRQSVTFNYLLHSLSETALSYLHFLTGHAAGLGFFFRPVSSAALWVFSMRYPPCRDLLCHARMSRQFRNNNHLPPDGVGIRWEGHYDAYCISLKKGIVGQAETGSLIWEILMEDPGDLLACVADLTVPLALDPTYRKRATAGSPMMLNTFFLMIPQLLFCTHLWQALWW